MDLQFLEETITLGIVAAIENEAFDYHKIFLQNETPPNFYVPVTEYQAEESSGCWIGCRRQTT